MIGNEHSRHFTWYVQRRFIQIASSRWRLEHCTFQRNKPGLFCIADSQRQANIKRQRGSKTCRATMSHPVDLYGESWDSTAYGSACCIQLKAMKSQFNLPMEGRKGGTTYREGGHTLRLTVGFHLLHLCWSCVWTYRTEGEKGTTPPTLMGPEGRHAK